MKYIMDHLYGEQPVGTSILVDAGKNGQRLIHTPTMRTPEVIKDPRTIYHCMRSTLICAYQNNIRSIVIPFFGMEYFFPIQGFGILALIPIWLYNGKLGKKNRVIQYGFYLFYPVHMLLLYVIYRFAF